MDLVKEMQIPVRSLEQAVRQYRKGFEILRSDIRPRLYSGGLLLLVGVTFETAHLHLKTPAQVFDDYIAQNPVEQNWTNEVSWFHQCLLQVFKANPPKLYLTWDIWESTLNHIQRTENQVKQILKNRHHRIVLSKLKLLPEIQIYAMQFMDT